MVSPGWILAVIKIILIFNIYFFFFIKAQNLLCWIMGSQSHLRYYINWIYWSKLKNWLTNIIYPSTKWCKYTGYNRQNILHRFHFKTLKISNTSYENFNWYILFVNKFSLNPYEISRPSYTQPFLFFFDFIYGFIPFS